MTAANRIFLFSQLHRQFFRLPKKLKIKEEIKMKDRITNTLTRHIGVISESSRGWKLELNMVSWNGAEPKLDIHDWSPDHQRCNNRGTFTREEARTLIKLLKKEV